MIRFEQVGKRYPNGHVGLHELSFGSGVASSSSSPAIPALARAHCCACCWLWSGPPAASCCWPGRTCRASPMRRFPSAPTDRRGVPESPVAVRSHRIRQRRPAVADPRVEQARDRPAGDDGAGAGQPQDKALQYPADLSTGQQQRVGIARAVVHRPALLLADEPTGNLDPRLAAEIMGVFEDINRLGTTVLIASHDRR